jgi:hypothetical protein
MEAAWAYHPILSPTEIAALYRTVGKELTNHLGIKLSMSTAFHPQPDGQTERINAVLEQYPHHVSSFQQDDWAELLPLAELFPLAEHAYNTAVSKTTKTPPFFANYGYQPETQPEIAIEHYRESRIPGRRLNEREKRMEYRVFWKGYPLEEATWEPWENLEGDEAVEALVKEFQQKYPQAVKDRRVSLE